MMKIISTLFFTVIVAVLASANPIAIVIVDEDGKTKPPSTQKRSRQKTARLLLA